MESFRPKRSKISGIPQFDSAQSHSFSSNHRPLSLQGNRHVQNPRNFPKLSSDSSSCSSGTADDDSFTFELGLRSSKQGLGTPMKKLLAKEMSKEMESKRRSPSVIAKLMGLDGLPTQQSAYREEKGTSESYLQATRSAEKGQRNCHRYDNRSSRKSSKDEQEFKDVFEVLEPSKVGSCSYPPSQGMANSNVTDAEMAFIRQKFMDAKRLSTDEKLQHSKEFHEALEVLDSNKDLLLKFLQQPDSLFTKHLHDLQGATPQPLCGRIAATKSSESQTYGNAHLISKSGREPLHRNRTASSQKHRARPCQSDCFAAQNSLKSSKSELERRGESTTQPTRIVVLKPNLGKVLNGPNTVPSPCSSHASLSESRKDIDIPLSRNREGEVLGRRKFQRDGGISGHKSIESREIAKEITRQMRNSFSNSSPKFSSTAFKGYAGDESSCSMSGNESANELEVMSTSCKYSFDLNNHPRPLSSRSTESSVSREAKKRLSERWRLTHESQDIGAVSRGSTLADMLAIDKERRPVLLDGITDAEGFKNKSSRDNRPAGWVEPLGISSRDGWKDGCISGLTRSRSLPSSSTVFGSPKAFMRREPMREDKYVIPKETFKRERIKAQKSNLEKRSVERNSRSNSKKSYHSDYTIRESNGNSPKSHTIHNQVDIELELSSPPEKKLEEVVESSAGNITDRSPVPKTPTAVEHEATISTRTRDNLLPELSSGTLVADASDADGRDDLNLLQEPPAEPHEESPLPVSHGAPGLESPASSKEAEQPSPVSVLEVPFTDDLSSCSECFESLSADLQGLRMQLQLLKLESESYEEGPMLISSDEDVGEGSTGLSYATRLHRSQQSWEYCYVVDVLLHSGLDDANPDVFLAAWHSPVSPVSPLVFEELEKKNYDHQTTQLKSERRLLFDRINLGILEMYRQFTDPHPWVRSATAVFGPRWSKNQLQDGLIRLLASQEKNAKKETSEKVLGSEEQWLDIRYNIDVIGGEFEKLLLDELLEELLVAM